MREHVDRARESWFQLLGVLAYLGLPVLAAARSDCDYEEPDVRVNLRQSA